MRLVCRLTWTVCVLLGSLGAAGAQGASETSPDVREACTPDVMRICSDVIPDVPKITKCMIAKYRQLSEPCRLAMARQHKAFQRRRYIRRAHVYHVKPRPNPN